jgi:hypothetical protein
VSDIMTMRPAFFDPDSVGAFADAMLVGRAYGFDAWGMDGSDRPAFLARFPVAGWFLDHGNPLAAFNPATPFPQAVGTGQASPIMVNN